MESGLHFGKELKHAESSHSRYAVLGLNFSRQPEDDLRETINKEPPVCRPRGAKEPERVPATLSTLQKPASILIEIWENYERTNDRWLAIENNDANSTDLPE